LPDNASVPTRNRSMPQMPSLTPERLRGMRRGIEKESLRADPGGWLAATPHPPALGSALTHPHITTDFSESQLELITGVHGSVEGCLDELRRIHQFVCRQIGDELLWVASMPCRLPADETIPIGSYGSSNVGRAKSVYRMGLGHRYGRRMQTISGIHYNWSLPGLTDDDHFAIIRNFRRHSFVLLTLFGASPAVCSSFVEGRRHELQPLGEHTLHLPHATSLRMGRLGYQSDAQASISASYNSLESYGASLYDAMTQPYPAYEVVGIRNPGGEYNQLATSLLQIENEFYGTIRPKRTIRPGERPLHALRERGVEYLEVRCMDLDPFEPLGISAATMRFLDVFLLHCLATDSPPDTPQENAALARNQHRTASHGRQPGLPLERAGREVPLLDWACEVVDGCRPLAALLDKVQGGGAHAAALAQADERLRDLENTPSARALSATRSDFGGSFATFALAQSEQTKQRLLELPYPDALAAEMRTQAQASLEKQRAIEAADRQDFESFRLDYLSPARLTPSP
jgi:glutamate--cysteine ligase